MRIEEYIGIFFLIIITFALLGWVADKTVPPMADALGKLAVTCSCESIPCNITLNSTTVRYNYTNTLNYTYNNTYVMYVNGTSNCTVKNVTCPTCPSQNKTCAQKLKESHGLGPLFDICYCAQNPGVYGFWTECLRCTE